MRRPAIPRDARHCFRRRTSGSSFITTANFGVIADDVAALDFDLDSLTPPPEGDMTIAEARAAWGDKFFWMHPPLGWFHEDRENVWHRGFGKCSRAPAAVNCCLMISEDVPHDAMETVPFLLDTFAANE